ncbi:hypothetical protein JCM15519_36340 [Fundidesulfovibrio butyratiphilus]
MYGGYFGYSFMNPLILLLIILVIFLVCREIVCWYWKLNKIVANQERQNQLLESILARLGGPESQHQNDKQP